MHHTLPGLTISPASTHTRSQECCQSYAWASHMRGLPRFRVPESACRPNVHAHQLPRGMQADVEQYKEIAKRVLPLVGDTVELINDAWDEGKRILIEGANATMLDLDFGTYPFVTSSNPSIGGVATGLGLPPTKFEAIIGVVCATLLAMWWLSIGPSEAPSY